MKYEKRHWYDNLRENETFIWNRFIEKYPDAYDEVIYNLHLGEGATIPPGTEENIARDFKLLTQYKVDVVGFDKNKIDIDPAATPNLVILTDQLRPDTAILAEKLNIKIIVV